MNWPNSFSQSKPQLNEWMNVNNEDYLLLIIRPKKAHAGFNPLFAEWLFYWHALSVKYRVCEGDQRKKQLISLYLLLTRAVWSTPGILLISSLKLNEDFCSEKNSWTRGNKESLFSLTEMPEPADTMNLSRDTFRIFMGHYIESSSLV